MIHTEGIGCISAIVLVLVFAVGCGSSGSTGGAGVDSGVPGSGGAGPGEVGTSGGNGGGRNGAGGSGGGPSNQGGTGEPEGSAGAGGSAEPDAGAGGSTETDAGAGDAHATGGNTSSSGVWATNYAIDAAHTNAQPDDQVASPLVERWALNLNGAVSYPLIVNDMVVVAAAESQPNIRALSLATGKLVWGPLLIGSGVNVAYDGGNVYALDGNGNLSAFTIDKGTKVWATKITQQLDFGAPPVAAGGLVYVNGLESGGTTVAVDGKTGIVRWTANTFDGSEGTVAVADGVVYEAEACDQLSAFDALTGHRMWYYSTGCTGGGGSTPSVYDGFVWVRDWAEGNVIIDKSGKAGGSFAADTPPGFDAGMVFYTHLHVLTAVDVATSTIKWSFSGDGTLCSSASIAGKGHQVFIGSTSGNVYELDETTGKQRSVVTAPSAVTCGTEKASLAIAGGRLAVPTGNALHVY